MLYFLSQGQKMKGRGGVGHPPAELVLDHSPVIEDSPHLLGKHQQLPGPPKISE